MRATRRAPSESVACVDSLTPAQPPARSGRRSTDNRPRASARRSRCVECGAGTFPSAVPPQVTARPNASRVTRRHRAAQLTRDRPAHRTHSVQRQPTRANRAGLAAGAVRAHSAPALSEERPGGRLCPRALLRPSVSRRVPACAWSTSSTASSDRATSSSIDTSSSVIGRRRRTAMISPSLSAASARCSRGVRPAARVVLSRTSVVIGSWHAMHPADALGRHATAHLDPPPWQAVGGGHADAQVGA